MHQFDDAETIALEVIDATLAGEAVEPEYADLAELTLILAGQRPVPSTEFAAALDSRVTRRFAQPVSDPARRARRRWLFAPGVALAAAAATAVVVVVSSGNGFNGGSSEAISSAAGSSAAASKPLQADRSGPQRTSSGGALSLRAASGTKTPPSSTPTSAAGSNNALSLASSTAQPSAPVPSTQGRQVVQSAQLSLSTNPDNVDAVAQQVFNVVAAQNGFVKSSQVTASGYAQFELSVPSSHLGQTMAALSRLHGAHVVARTDSTQDITQQVGGAGMRLADARALHAALLRKLAAATTTAEIDSVKARIAAVEATIARDRTRLRSLHRQVNFSSIAVTINAAMVPVHKGSSGGSFTIGKALHDAGRVLVVAAGVGLITLAVLVPVGLVIAVILWVAYAIRRRRREHALDLV
jgi:Domain of unknown function (DUF4349)